MTTNADNPERDDRGRFAVGNAGGPGGARRRQHDLRRAVEEAVSPEHLTALIRKATRMGLEGNLTAMRLVLERTCGRAPEALAEAEPLGVQLPRLRTAADCEAAIERLVEGLCKGTVDREAAKVLIDAIQIRLKAIETTELEARLAELERKAGTVHLGAGSPSRRF